MGLEQAVDSLGISTHTKVACITADASFVV